MIKKFEGYVPKGEGLRETFEGGRSFWGQKRFGMFSLKGTREDGEFYPQGFIKRTITIEVKDEEV